MVDNRMKAWLLKATQEERDKLVALAATTLGTIRQIAGGYRTGGHASTTPELAKRIELASVKVARTGLPAVKREALCQACAECEFAKQYRKDQK